MKCKTILIKLTFNIQLKMPNGYLPKFVPFRVPAEAITPEKLDQIA